ncbi:hypothetical protein PMI31_06067, partial [Pseudomonas sp. GM55]
LQVTQAGLANLYVTCVNRFRWQASSYG